LFSRSKPAGTVGAVRSVAVVMARSLTHINARSLSLHIQ
jgi:hypothetical protein